MLSGRETLAELTSTLGAARAELERLETDLNRTSAALTRNRREQAQTLRQLAELRLDELRQGRLGQALTQADREAATALEERERASRDLETLQQHREAQLQDLETERQARHAEVDAAAEQLAALEAELQSALERDDAYQAQLERTRQAARVAQRALEKAEQAEADRLGKGQPYEQDPLFSYLWKRRYGRPEYSGRGLFRWLDGWVAGLIGYEAARANYWLLLEIPRRLREHAVHEQDVAEESLRTLRALEEAAGAARGLPETQARLAQAEAAQDSLDTDIAACEDELRQVQEELGRFAAGEDPYVQRGLRLLSEAFARREVAELRAQALSTAGQQDDQLVSELKDLRELDDDIQAELVSHRRLHHTHLERVRELEQVRRRFKARRFDDVRSEFGNEQMLLMLLAQFLQGGVNGNALWDALQRQQRYRDVGGAWPDFGSGGLGRSRHAGPWHWPGGRGGFRLPRSGGPSSRGGGFRTGGGF